MGKQQVVVVTLLSLFAGCQSQSQQGARSTAPVIAAPAATAAPVPESTDASHDGPPGAVAAPGGQTEWWCTVATSEPGGFCGDDAQSCEALRKELLDAAVEDKHSIVLSPCAKATEVACLHPGVRRVDRDCFPTLTLCNAMRGYIHKYREIEPKDECTMYGTAPAAPAQH